MTLTIWAWLHRIRHNVLVIGQRIFDLLKRAVESYAADHVSTLAAALAYHTLFSLAPLLVLAVGVAGFVFREDAALGVISDQLAGALGEEVAELVESWVISAASARGAAVVVGAALAIFAGSGVFLHLQSALSRVLGAAEPLEGLLHGVWRWVRQRLLAFGSALGIGLILIALLASQSVLRYLQRWVEVPGLVRYGGGAVAIATLTVVIGLMFQYLTTIRVPWRAVTIGALFTAITLSLAALLVGIYLGEVSGRGTFAAVGSVAVLLFFVYLMAQVFLFGAEVTKVLADRQAQSLTPNARGREASGLEAPSSG